MSIDAPLHESVEKAPHRDWSGLVVPPAMLVAAAAMAIASNLHLGLSTELALAIGVALFCLMLMCHVLLRAADEAERAAEEAAERSMEQVSSPMPVEALAPATPARAADEPTAWPSTEQGAAPMAASDRGPADPAPVASAWAFRPADIMAPTVPAAFPQDRLPPETTSSETAALQAAALGALRPTMDEHGYARSSTDREGERIDAILKRLATQIQAGSAAQATSNDMSGATDEPKAAGPSLAEQSPAVHAAAAASETTRLEALAVTHPDTALSSAVDALRSTVAAMRGALEPAPAAPLALPDASPAELRLAAVAEALAAERAEVFLAPILGLTTEQARHFEVSAQLRSADGEALDARDIAAGAGLLPLLDALGVRHAAGFALMLERRGREGAVFSQVGGISLESERFVGDVASRHAQGIADRLVLSFAQEEMRTLGPAQIDALGDLGRLGFRFALQGVADLDMDFEALAALGFEFVKLDAHVFQCGLQYGDVEIPASEICRHFEDLGLAVIVSGINDAATRERMIGCGVVFGQGPLFGEPRPVPLANTAARPMAA